MELYPNEICHFDLPVRSMVYSKGASYRARLRDSFNIQHDFVIPVVGGEATTYVYVGDRYSQHHGKGVGRNVFLPLIWEDGEPTLKWYKTWRIDTAARGRTDRCRQEHVDP